MIREEQFKMVRGESTDDWDDKLCGHNFNRIGKSSVTMMERVVYGLSEGMITPQMVTRGKVHDKELLQQSTK